MKVLLSALADGTLAGVVRWYAEKHTRDCPGCAQTLDALHDLRGRLHALNAPDDGNALSAERRRSLEAAFDTIDAALASPGERPT
jgi:hypothetical protein